MRTAAKRLVETMLGQAGIQPGGSAPWDIRIHDERLYDRIVSEKNLGLGNGYVEGWWDCPRVDSFIWKVLSAGLNTRLHAHLKLLVRAIPSYILNMQTRRGATKVAREHYDLGNDLFFSFLDPYRQYSCGYFKDTRELDQAQIAKMEMICRKLDLSSRDHVLDIGCGWGGLAKYMATQYGCRVTGINISKEQIEYARTFCKGLPVEILDQDYRDVRGSFDKIVSVGMFEHVGSKNYRCFMEQAHSLLKKHGIFLLHTIGGNAVNSTCDPWITRYIFPHGMLPSMAQIARACEDVFVIEDVHNIGPHYDPTLLAWHKGFMAHWEGLKERYGEAFRRMWEYYLLSCAGAFRARDIQVWQVVMTEVGQKQPVCR